MATLEHVTFLELGKLMRALALTEQEHLDNARGLLGNWLSCRDGACLLTESY